MVWIDTKRDAASVVNLETLRDARSRCMFVGDAVHASGSSIHGHLSVPVLVAMS